MPNIQADTAAIQAAAAKFASESTQLAELISAVTADFQGLEGLWAGPAFQSFLALMEQWQKDVLGIQSVLEQVGKRVDSAGVGYSDLDTQIANSFH